jgi:branched-chain amino acid transport system permease protein
LPLDALTWVPLAVLAGGRGRAPRLVVAFPSFKTRGDYLALVTLAFLMIVIGDRELDVIGGRAASSA